VERIQISNYTFKHDFKDGFPAITTKKLFWKGVVGELLWFLRGDTNIKYLNDNGIHIWDKDATNFSNNGHCGRIYGAQWRDWSDVGFDKISNRFYDQGLDQISNLIKGLKETPMGTKHIVTAWNPAELDEMALPPCHWSFEILVEPIDFKTRNKLSSNYNVISNNKFKNRTSFSWKEAKENIINLWDKFNVPKYQFTLKWHQRSVDTFLGLPFNIASYALLAHIIGKMTNMIPKGIIGDLSNVHIYVPHIEAVKEQMSRNFSEHDKCELEILIPNKGYYTQELNKIINGFDINDFQLENYKSYPAIKAEMLSYNK
jgi:thymidylate synthase